MVANDDRGPKTAPGFLAQYVFSTNHKTIGLQYLWLALASVFVGLVLSTLLRASAALPVGFDASPERYAALRLLHGSLMVFFVLMAAPQLGFGNYLLPLQIGAEEMAFPTLNLASFWMTAMSLVGMTASFFMPVESGITVWLASAAVFSLGALLSALNFTVTTISQRTKGMTLPRMPVTVWAWFLNAVLSLLIFSVLLAGATTILSDRLLGTQFFASQAMAPAEWERLFWYFAQAEVYVAMLPCFGIVTHLLATFAQRPIWRERLVVLAMCAVGVTGFCVWGYHMFATGLDPFSPLVFGVLASSLGIPAMILLASWLRTIWDARIELKTAALFALGFVALFIAGGLSGVFLANHKLTRGAVTEDFVIGHFHLVMGVAATFALLGALFFWFPRLFGCRMNERLGKLHFWMTFAGVFCVFMPMHWLGLLESSGSISPAPARVIGMLITVATFWTIGAQVIFAVNFVGTLAARRAMEEENPWRAATLEWNGSLPIAGTENGWAATVYRGAYEEFAGISNGFIPQNMPPEMAMQKARV